MAADVRDRGRVLVAVDGGGTHTRAVAAWEHGGWIGRGQAPGSNPAAAGLQAALRSLDQAIGQALGEVISRQAVACCCVGLAGIDRPADRLALEQVVGRLDLGGTVELVNDAVIAWAGATGGLPGVVVVGGTGSIAYGRSADGRERRCGGWGAPFGDEGSAFDLGNRAVGAALRAVDGRGVPTALVAAFCRRLGVADPEDIGVAVRRSTEGGVSLTAAVASLAPVVVDVAAQGDPVALGIVQAAADALVDLAAAVVRGLGLQGSDRRVIPRGSVLVGAEGAPTPVMGPLFRQRLVDRLGVEPSPARYPPLIGGLILAWSRLHPGQTPPEGLVRSWQEE